MELDGSVLICIAVVAIVGIAAIGFYLERKRKDRLRSLAHKLGLRFSEDKDRSLADRFMFLDKLRHGSNRYAFDVFTGTFSGHEVVVFDYHYETHSRNSRGGRQTHHHYASCFVTFLPCSFPEVTIAREGFLSKIAQAVGYDDIDFESHEFSRAFCVRSADKKFAYDVCNAKMIEYLLGNRDLSIEIDQDVVALVFSGKMKPDVVGTNIERLVKIRELLPEYLFEGSRDNES